MAPLLKKRMAILHLDDQPENISAIPTSLYYWFSAHFAHEMDNSPDPAQDHELKESTFSVHSPPYELAVIYYVAANVEEFQEFLNKSKKEIAVIILDQTIGNDHVDGSTVYTQITSEDPTAADKLLFLTSYPAEVCHNLHWRHDDPRLVIRPPRGKRLLHEILSRFSKELAEIKDVHWADVADRIVSAISLEEE